MDDVSDGRSYGLDPVERELGREQLGANGSDAQERVPDRSCETAEGGALFRLFEDHAALAGIDPDLQNLVIPSAVSGLPVTEVLRSACEGSASLESVVMPSGVVRVGSRAFRGCTALEYVELSSELTVINSRCFEGCTSLQVVMLPYELRRLCRRSFRNCRSLKRLPHFVKTGISATMRIDRDVVEENLPTNLEYIGVEAFSGCTKLERAVIPYEVTTLNDGLFQGCGELNTVWLHSRIKCLGDRVFEGCRSLSEIRIPGSVVSVGKDCFPDRTKVLCEEGSLPVFSPETWVEPVASVQDAGRVFAAMGAGGGERDIERLLSDPMRLGELVDAYQIRPAVDEVDRVALSRAENTRPARFTFDDGVYKADAPTSEGGEFSIVLTGDLMCRVFQQQHALQDSIYDFSPEFESVARILRASDLAIGNMETMVAESFPFMREKQYVDDRPHLNAPFAFLAAVRNAGFDVVLNAQNHMYDTGAKGVVETLGALSKARLIHGGMYLHPDDQRFLLVEKDGIRVGIVSYLDGARQKMKQSYFSQGGLATIVSHFDPEQVRKDITEARDAGADFVLAYGHWGREYTETITARQERFAQLLADSGADYVFGSHSHCPQQYTVLESSDGRRVPVVYSGGNFISDLGIRKPYTQDSIICSLVLGRDAQGRVTVVRDGYVPCRILAPADEPGAVVVKAFTEGPTNAVSIEARRRIAETMGAQYQQLSADNLTGRVSYPASERSRGDAVSRYSLREPLIARLSDRDEKDSARYDFDNHAGLWRQKRKTAVGEALVICTGSVLYDRPLERAGAVGERHEFRTSFSNVRGLLRAADLTVGSFGSLVDPEFPSIGVMTSAMAGGHYTNAPPEFLDALNYAGFDCLALAHPYDLDLGVRGVLSTEREVRQNGMVPSGLGESRFPVFDVNGIRVAPISYTLDLYRTRTFITGEGAKALLNRFDAGRARDDIRRLRSSGADFVIGYLDCRSSDGKYRYRERLEHARELAEFGADYVVCTNPNLVSKYTRHRTRDGRLVPIASSLGTFMSGHVGNGDRLSAALRIVVRLNEDNSLELTDSYVPLKRFRRYGSGFQPVVPALRRYNPAFASRHFKKVRTVLAKRLGAELPIDQSRKVRMSTHNQAQISLAEIQQLLGVQFSGLEKERLAEREHEKIARVVTRREDLRRGCVAVQVRHESYRRELEDFTVEDAVSAGALCIISEKHYEEIPTLVVEDPSAAFRAILGVIRDKYSPLTVAITGTVGKTTTKELMSEVFGRHFRTLHVEGNNNTSATVGVVLQKLTDEDEAYIQEVHGGSLGAARDVSNIIRPDICLITNIGDGHLGQMGTIENVIEGKMQVIDGMRPGGTLVINDDNEYLHVQHPPVRTVRYSVHNSDCPYYARGIVDGGDHVEFQIVSPEGAFDARLNFQGLHNVSNAVGVFATASQAGIPPNKIIAGLSRFVPDSVRQNLCEVGGYKLLIDTYSSTPLSVVSAVETLCGLPSEPGARRVAVVGDIPDLGEKSQSDHLEVGKTIGAMPVDYLLCCGEDSRYMVEAARAEGMNAEFFEGRKEMNRALSQLMRPGDTVLFKAGTRVHLKEQTIYPLFGKIV